MVHLARLGGFHDDADRGAQALANEMMVHGRAGEQRRDRNAVGAGAAIGQDDDVDAVAHGGLGLSAQGVDRPFHAGSAGFSRPGRIERERFEMIVARLSEIERIFSRFALVRIG